MDTLERPLFPKLKPIGIPVTEASAQIPKGATRLPMKFQPKQRILADLIFHSNYSWIAYGGAKGGGKASPLESIVYTPSGPVKMGDLAVGGAVSCPDGSTAKIVAVWEHPKSDVYRVTFDDGASLEAKLDHLWCVRGPGNLRFDGSGRRSDNHQWSVIDTATLAATLKIGRRIYIPLTTPVEFIQTEELPLAPYALGALLGDGAFQALVTHEQVCFGKSVASGGCGRSSAGTRYGYRTYAYDRVRMTSADPEIVARCASVGATPWSDIPKKNNRAREYAFDQGVAAAIRKCGLAGKKAWEKFVPKQYLFAPVVDREELLRGLMDTDGSVDSRGHACFSSSSPRLASDVQWLARSLGYKANVTSFSPRYWWKGTKRSGRQAYRVWIKGDSQADLFFVPRKKERAALPFGGRKENGAKGASRARRVISVEFSRNTDCRCITIDHPAGLYVADDFVVTHNSGGARRLALAFCTQFPGVDVLFMRQVFSEVFKNHVLKMWAEYPQLEQHFNKGEAILYLSNGSKIHFGYGEHEGDVRRYNGAADWAAIFVDQAEEFPDSDLAVLKSCVRSTIPGFTPKLVLTFNPGGQAHSYLKRIFVDRQFLDEERPDDYAPLLRAYGWDNFEWIRSEAQARGVTADDYYYGWDDEKRKEFFLTTNYGKGLLGLPRDLQSKYLWGSFEIFEGQFFDKFQPQKVGYMPHEVTLLDYWPWWVSIDGGYDHPSAVYVHTWDGTTVYTFKEFVKAGLEPAELAHAVAKLLLFTESGQSRDGLDGRPPRPNVVDVILSFDWFRKDQSLKSRADVFGEVMQAYNLPWPRESSRDRIGRLRLASQMMSDDTGQGFPSWRVNRVECRDLMRTIPLCIRDTKRDDDMLKFNGDDPIDGASYGLMVQFANLVIPEAVRLAQRIDQFADPQTRAMQARIAAAEAKASMPFFTRRHAYNC